MLVELISIYNENYKNNESYGRLLTVNTQHILKIEPTEVNGDDKLGKYRVTLINGFNFYIDDNGYKNLGIIPIRK